MERMVGGGMANRMDSYKDKWHMTKYIESKQLGRGWGGGQVDRG